jgi:hypothetical protein
MSKKQTTSHYFGEELKKYYKDILEQAVYLNCKKEFVEKKNIWCPNISEEDDWNDFVTFCLEQPFPNDDISGKQYAYDFEWFCFLKKSFMYGTEWMAELIDLYKGIDNFYDKAECDNEKKNKIILWLLKGAMKSTIQIDKKNLWKILFVEADSDKNYVIQSKDEIEKAGKTLFFRNPSNNEDDDLSVYVYEDVFAEDKEKDDYKKCLEGFVSEKDWIGFVSNKLKELLKEQKTDLETIYEKTFEYVLKLKNDEIIKITIPEEIKEKASKVILPAKFFPKLKNSGQKAYLERIAGYLAKPDKDNFGYRLFGGSIKDDDDIKKSYRYLKTLGVKTEPKIIKENGMCTFDKLTQAIMPDYSNTSTDVSPQT